jgi:hypothetical protein
VPRKILAQLSEKPVHQKILKQPGLQIFESIVMGISPSTLQGFVKRKVDKVSIPARLAFQTGIKSVKLKIRYKIIFIMMNVKEYSGGFPAEDYPN